MRVSPMAQAAPAPRQNRQTWPLVSAVVVNYNGAQHLARCIDSLCTDGYPALEVLVVDNASTDGSAALLTGLQMRHPRLTVLSSAHNLGYAGAVNLALPHARGDYLAVLNMDLEVQRGWLAELVAFLEAHPQVAAVNPLVALADGEYVNALGQDVHVTGLGFNRGLGRPVGTVGRAPFPVTGIQGGAFVVRRAVLEQIGGMDAAGWLYHEDVNLSWLLQLLGYDLYCVPTAVVRHDYKLTMYPVKLYLLERNRWAMLASYLRWPTLVALSPLLLLTEGLMWSYCALKGPAFLVAKARSYVWVVAQWPRLRHRRRWVERARVRTDWALLRRLRWGYAWNQFLILGRARGRSERARIRELPPVSPPERPHRRSSVARHALKNDRW
ncbi:MAG: glycosyltransferase family 2 protein [Chloroflexi bacterium]|nr:glycosyltransferase family 2 protein [Chloroflexota bacterium]